VRRWLRHATAIGALGAAAAGATEVLRDRH
jgi:hypothetical protein